MSTALVPASGIETLAVMTREEMEQTATLMARTFREGTAEIRKLMEAIEVQTVLINDAFDLSGDPDPVYRRNDFDITFEHGGDRYNHAKNAGRLFDKMKRRAWAMLVNKLGIKNIMSVKRRGEFEQQLEKGDLPEITEDNILGLVASLYGQAQDFASEAAREVFELLRPSRGDYKTNHVFRVGLKVILDYYVERGYGNSPFRPSHYHEVHLTAIDGVFHLLDGKGFIRERYGPLVQAILDSPDGRGETEYFKFKAFKNRNLHLTMKRPDLVMDLNFRASGERVLGNDMTE